MVTNDQLNPMVVKIGGSTLGSHDTTLQDLVELQRQGLPVIVVHGGGSKVTGWLNRQGTEAVFRDGLRVTDGASLEVVAAVLGGLVNVELVAAVNDLGGRAVGLTGVDGNLIQARITNPDFGYVGEITEVNLEVLQPLLAAGYIPMIAPPCAVVKGEEVPVLYLNVNGDDMAGAIADAFRARMLIFLTDVEGIQGADGEVITSMTVADVAGLIEAGVINRGMIPKARAALTAMKNASRVKIVDGRNPHVLLSAIKGETGGTTIDR